MTIYIVLSLLIFQIYVNAAPSDISKLEDIAAVENADSKLDSEPPILEDENKNENNSSQVQRQKRWYNYYGYGFPPINPLIYPSNVKRDDSPNTAIYGMEDPFTQIHRRLQEIANAVRQPAPPQPPPNQFPIFFPVLFVPQIGCNCNPGTNNNQPQQPPSNPNNNPINPNNNPLNPNNNETMPDLANRFPEMDDVRQNWGFVINESAIPVDEEEDVGRPISFIPVRVNRTMIRPAPPVDNGSTQEGSQDGVQRQPQTTTASPPIQNPSSISAQPPNSLEGPPSMCDGAVLSCCHQAEVTYDCFVLQGCPDPTSYGNPCDVNVILSVIDRFQRYYGQRTG